MQNPDPKQNTQQNPPQYAQYPQYQYPPNYPGMQHYPGMQGPQAYGQGPYPIYQQPMVNGGMVGPMGYPAQMDPEMAKGYQMIPNPPYGQAGQPIEVAPVRKTGFEKLQALNGILIKQKLEALELVIGCETENKYNVFAIDKDGNKKGRKIFKCKEKSDCCARICLSGNCRPFNMEINTLVRGEDDDYEPFLRLERPCKCTCLCFDRPEVLVTLVEGGRNEFLGKIIDPWNWCNMEFKVYDKENAKKYTIEGSCCQLGVWCRCPCEPCQTVSFDVKSPSGEVISKLEKRSAGCVQSWATDMDNFVLNFPQSATLQDKALLMSAVLFLDYRHFEQNPRNNDNGM